MAKESWTRRVTRSVRRKQLQEGGCSEELRFELQKEHLHVVDEEQQFKQEQTMEKVADINGAAADAQDKHIRIDEGIETDDDSSASRSALAGCSKGSLEVMVRNREKTRKKNLRKTPLKCEINVERKGTKRKLNDEPQEYVVECILDKRLTVEYLVQWKNFPVDDATWERLENVKDCVHVDEFERKLNNRQSSEVASIADEDIYDLVVEKSETHCDCDSQQEHNKNQIENLGPGKAVDQQDAQTLGQDHEISLDTLELESTLEENEVKVREDDTVSNGQGVLYFLKIVGGFTHSVVKWSTILLVGLVLLSIGVKLC